MPCNKKIPLIASCILSAVTMGWVGVAHAASPKIECGRYRLQGKLLAPKKPKRGKAATLETLLPGSKELSKMTITGLSPSELRAHRGRMVSVEVDIIHSATFKKAEGGAVFGSLKRLPASTRAPGKMQLLQRDRCQ